MTAHYQCRRCDHEWRGPIASAHEGCIRCGHQYVSWLNYAAGKALGWW